MRNLQPKKQASSKSGHERLGSALRRKLQQAVAEGESLVEGSQFIQEDNEETNEDYDQMTDNTQNIVVKADMGSPAANRYASKKTRVFDPP